MQLLTYFKRHRWLQAALMLVLGAGFALSYRAGTTEPIDSYAACVNAGYPVLESYPSVCRAGNRNFTDTAARPATPAPDTVQSLEFETLVDGDTQTGLPERGQVLINDQAQWEAYWRRAHSHLATMPPLIPVDFRGSSVVAASLGPQTTTGYTVRVTGISQSEGTTYVNLIETIPTIACKVENTVTNRYLIVRTEKIAEPVSFRVSSQKRSCQ